MISKEKHKHDKIAQPAPIPQWAILGTTCEQIKTLSDHIIAGLSNSYKIVFADAAHESPNEYPIINKPYATIISHSNHKELSISNLSKYNIYDHLPLADAILLNGNHFKGNAQILVTDSLKHLSVQKHLQDLTNVDLILIKDGTPLPDFAIETFPQLNKVPHLNFEDTENIIAFIRAKLEASKPSIFGLVMAGGKSVRLGQDKTKIKWHGIHQREYAFELLKSYCQQTFISASAGHETDESLPIIRDSFTGLGPYGGILSAFQKYPDKAWLVVACDLPLFDKSSILQLIEQRNPSSIATSLESPHDSLPEPLAAIWEPKAYPVLLQYLSRGYSCPRKVMIQNDVTKIKSNNPLALKNVNTPADFEEVQAILNLQDKH